jgi:hypothetical protein
MNHTQCHAPGRSNNRTHETDEVGHATTVTPHGQVTSQDPCVGASRTKEHMDAAYGTIITAATATTTTVQGRS